MLHNSGNDSGRTISWDIFHHQYKLCISSTVELPSIELSSSAYLFEYVLKMILSLSWVLCDILHVVIAYKQCSTEVCFTRRCFCFALFLISIFASSLCVLCIHCCSVQLSVCVCVCLCRCRHHSSFLSVSWVRFIKKNLWEGPVWFRVTQLPCVSGLFLRHPLEIHPHVSLLVPAFLILLWFRPSHSYTEKGPILLLLFYCFHLYRAVVLKPPSWTHLWSLFSWCINI